jgi:hypothetical protein
MTALNDHLFTFHKKNWAGVFQMQTYKQFHDMHQNKDDQKCRRFLNRW